MFLERGMGGMPAQRGTGCQVHCSCGGLLMTLRSDEALDERVPISPGEVRKITCGRCRQERSIAVRKIEVR